MKDHYRGRQVLAVVAPPDMWEQVEMGRRYGDVGMPLVDKRAEYLRLMDQGISSADACRRVGVHLRTGARWRNGRVVHLVGGQARVYAPIVRPDAVPTSSRYLAERERIVIADGLRAGLSGRKIAALLPGRAVTTVCREIVRNSDPVTGEYRPFAAQNAMLARRPRPKTRKLQINAVLRETVQALLDKRWSPEQISHTLERAGAETISVESIYQAIYSANTPLRREGRLRTGRLRRIERRRPEQRLKRFSTPMTPIAERAAEVDERLVGGHWEGDLIIGRGGRSAIGTLVERTTRFTILVHLGEGRSADRLRDEMIDVFAKLPLHARRSLTWDQGMEMCHHHQLTSALAMPVFFCDPHSPWQRGTNENTNGLLRQYFPKGTDLSAHSQEHLVCVAAELNDRPRKVLGWQCPTSAFSMLINNAV